MPQQFVEQPHQRVPLSIVQGGEGSGGNIAKAAASAVQHRLSFSRKAMRVGAARTDLALDPALADQPCGQGAEGLIGIECQRCQSVHRGAGVAVDLAQRIPLHKADTQFGQRRIERPMLAVLEFLDRKAEDFG